MAELPILPLSTDAILGDTLNMSAEQFGAYVRILLVSDLPDNDAEMARIAGVSLRRWRRIREPVMRAMTEGYSPHERGWFGCDFEASRVRAKRMAAARALGTHTKAEWIDLREQIGCCANCRAVDCELVRDHIIPVSRGGCDCIQNIQPLCARCNSSKGASL